jgi:ABC-type amino acid transport system permease subunit
MTDHAHSGAGFPGPSAPQPKAAPKTNLLYSEKFRAILYQVVLIAVVIGVGFFLVSNTLANLAAARHSVWLRFSGCARRF